MSITTLSSREFNQRTSAAKKPAMAGPVFVTDRGRPAYVLLAIEHYPTLTGQTLAGTGRSMVEMLAMKDGDDIEVDPPRMCDPTWKVPDLS